MIKSLPAGISLGNPEQELDAVNQQILKKVETLEHLSQKGCSTLQLLGKMFMQERQKMCEACGDTFAFLQSARLIDQLRQYERMNPRTTETGESISALIETRELLRAKVIFKKAMQSDTGAAQ